MVDELRRNMKIFTKGLNSQVEDTPINKSDQDLCPLTFKKSGPFSAKSYTLREMGIKWYNNIKIQHQLI
jgi:hypothetical protein